MFCHTIDPTRHGTQEQFFPFRRGVLPTQHQPQKDTEQHGIPHVVLVVLKALLRRERGRGAGPFLFRNVIKIISQATFFPDRETNCHLTQN